MKRSNFSLLCLILIVVLLSSILSGCGKKDTIDEQQPTAVPTEIISENTPAPTDPPAIETTATPTAEPASTPVPEPTSIIEGLDPVQRNSVYMLNYLAVITQEIIDSSNNRLNLEEIYSILENYTKPSAVNEDTQDQLSFLFDTINIVLNSI